MDIRIGHDGEKRKVRSAAAYSVDGGVSLSIDVAYGNVGHIRLNLSTSELAAIVRTALAGEPQDISAALAEPTAPR